MPLLALLAQGATLCILFLFLFLFNINQNEGFDRHSKSQNPSLGFSTRFDGSSSVVFSGFNVAAWLPASHCIVSDAPGAADFVSLASCLSMILLFWWLWGQQTCFYRFVSLHCTNYARWKFDQELADKAWLGITVNKILNEIVLCFFSSLFSHTDCYRFPSQDSTAAEPEHRRQDCLVALDLLQCGGPDEWWFWHGVPRSQSSRGTRQYLESIQHLVFLCMILVSTFQHGFVWNWAGAIIIRVILLNCWLMLNFGSFDSSMCLWICEVKCQLQSGGELVEIDSPQEIIFHLPPAVTIQSHNLQWMLECLVFDHWIFWYTFGCLDLLFFGHTFHFTFPSCVHRHKHWETGKEREPGLHPRVRDGVACLRCFFVFCSPQKV